MQLTNAPRIEHGRCATLTDTVTRLTRALDGVCAYEYEETRAGDSLYWGVCHVEGLGFPAMGKGTSSAACKASALAETIEWLTLRRRRALPGYVTAHQADLPDALPIEHLLSHIADMSPDLLAQIKATPLAQHWIDGYSLTEGRTKKIPLEYVHGISGTNGVATGNRLEEAVVQGLCEVLERRTVITTMRNTLTLPTIDVTTIDDADILAQLAFLEQQGTQVIVKDLSFGGILPVIGVYLVTPGIPVTLQGHHLFKAAAAYDRRAALSSCLTEYAQVCHLGARDGDAAPVYERLLCEGETADNFLPLFWFGYVPYTRADFLAQGEVVPFDAGALAADCLTDIDRFKEICAMLDLDLVVVDLTDPALDVPVVQVIMPGYSDILPYHPATSPVLHQGWTRDLQLGRYRDGDTLKPCTAAALFPGWS